MLPTFRLTTPHQWFTSVHLSDAHLDWLYSAFQLSFTTSQFPSQPHKVVCKQHLYAVCGGPATISFKVMKTPCQVAISTRVLLVTHIYRSKVTHFRWHACISIPAGTSRTSRRLFVPLLPEVWCQTSIVNTRCAPAAMRGRTFTFFVPRRTFSRKKFGASKNSGTAGGQTWKGQKVKVFIYNKL